MATTVRQQADDAFDIHEDARTEETELMADDEADGLADEPDDVEDAEPPVVEEHDDDDDDDDGDGDDNNDHDDEAHDDGSDDTSDDQVEGSVQDDMDKLQADFPGFRDRYRLIKRIGEGTFSTVFKAEDMHYSRPERSWDPFDDGLSKWTPPPLKRQQQQQQQHQLAPSHARRHTRYVAIKKIYVTSSPARILNELELLHDLRRCPSVCPLLTAFRATDQVVAILPYFRHGDFRSYFRDMTVPDIVIYLRCLLTALKGVHEHGILHRDIKPTNFLYDPATQHGVLVDFGLAEREGSDCRPCLCHEPREVRRQRQAGSVWAQGAAAAQPGYPKSDTRPSRRANRAGTRGFRAPEVLFKCTEQTTAIDVWSVGVILLTILSKRFPFFNSADDVEAMIEIATVFGAKRMKAAGLLHGCVFETSIPTIGQQGFTMEKIILWSTCRIDGAPLSPDEELAVRFLERCMDLDPTRRISAEQALQHEFLAVGEPPSEELGDDDEMDMLLA